MSLTSDLTDADGPLPKSYQLPSATKTISFVGSLQISVGPLEFPCIFVSSLEFLYSALE